MKVYTGPTSRRNKHTGIPYGIRNKKSLFISVLMLLLTLVSCAAPLPPADITSNTDAQPIPLPPAETGGDVSVEKALISRRSVRTYAADPLTLREVSQLLWAAQGAVGDRRTVPSAGALYPIDVFLVCGEVEGLPPGVYRYRSESHELILTAEDDRRSALYAAALSQPCVENAPAVLLMTGVYARTMEKYGDRGVRYVHMEAGHAAQNVYLQAAALNLGTVCIGAFDDEGVKEAAALPEENEPLYIMPVGGAAS
ncbi:MAG: SagB/ThcOx family dehydrogenase [Christensenellales bacterium]|jgi:SagB-type dehydrogenase family enzyme